MKGHGNHEVGAAVDEHLGDIARECDDDRLGAGQESGNSTAGILEVSDPALGSTFKCNAGGASVE